MKKVLGILICAALTVSAASALDLSAGVGGLFEAGLGGGVKRDGYEMSLPTIGGGGFVFFDATYAELGIGFSGGSLTTKISNGGQSLEDKGSYSSMHFSLLGKYPFALGEKVKLFPLLGIDYQLVLSAKNSNGDKADEPADFSSLAFKFGVGADYGLTDHLFLRGQFLYGIRLANKTENDAVDASNADYNLGHGPTIKVAVGYTF